MWKCGLKDEKERERERERGWNESMYMMSLVDSKNISCLCKAFDHFNADENIV